MEATAEIKPNPKVYTVTCAESDPIDRLIQRYSSWYGLKKAVAWVLRLKLYLRTKEPITGELSVAELRAAETALVTYVQTKTLSKEPTKANSLHKLSPIQTEDGVWCVGGRLGKADLHFQMKHPWILPANHHITDLVIQHCHILAGHSGVERVLAETRRGFWIVKGRTTVKRVLSKCITCKKLKAQPMSKLMGDLPKDRITPNEPPFTHVGVDYFGPFLVKRNRSELKRYGCLFTCLTTRAIHIEVSQSLETDSFINALQRSLRRTC